MRREIKTNKGMHPSVRDAARYFQVSTKTIRAWCRVGNSPDGIIFEFGKIHKEMPKYSKIDPILVKTYGRNGNMYLLYRKRDFSYDLFLYEKGVKIHLFSPESVEDSDKIVKNEI